MTADTILEARQISKTYRPGTAGEVHAVRDVSLPIARGSVVALTGPSGSGKTTLLALLGGLERPSSGSLFFLGHDLGALSDAALARMRRNTGFVFQDFSLIPGLSAVDNITHPLIPRGIALPDRLGRARELLDRFGLGDRGNARPEELSGGEQQRVALARALAGDPDLVLADEPTSNLDPDSAAVVLAAFRAIHAEGRTIVLATHDPFVAGLATVTYVLDRGRIDGGPA